MEVLIGYTYNSTTVRVSKYMQVSIRSGSSRSGSKSQASTQNRKVYSYIDVLCSYALLIRFVQWAITMDWKNVCLIGGISSSAFSKQVEQLCRQ